MEQNKFEQNLTEKYLPTKFEDLILPSKIKSEIFEELKKNSYRLLFSGSAGTGKTSLARVLNFDRNIYDVMYLSGSNDFNIDLVRNKIQPFVAGYPRPGRKKTLIIDECENIRDNLQDSFKITLDQGQNCNFIFITNEIEKVNLAVLNRFKQFSFDFGGTDLTEQQTGYIKFIAKICQNENIQFDNDGILELYKRNFPSFRSLLLDLDRIKSRNEVLNSNTVKTLSDGFVQLTELYELIENKTIAPNELYSKLSFYSGKENMCFRSLGEPYFEYLNSRNLYNKTLEVCIVVSDFTVDYVTSINKFTTFLACIMKLRTLFR